jgi:hypothetical protein
MSDLMVACGQTYTASLESIMYVQAMRFESFEAPLLMLSSHTKNNFDMAHCIVLENEPPPQIWWGDCNTC